MDNRTRILEAAARVYAEHGFRGATTRRIAQAAGVNEVTLFRTFGSKAALIDEALRAHATLPPGCAGSHALPADPVRPERELAAWAAAQLAVLRRDRALIRQAMSELEERPNAAPCVSHGWRCADDELRDYIRRLAKLDLIAAGRDDALAAGAMLMAALFSDAMGRDMMPDLYPPAEKAPALYVRLFLRAVDCRGVPRPGARAARRGARPGTRAPARARSHPQKPT
jgi:AcrR family transcriptional regulator